jgi:vacuolar-type H+-ATPase subunit E/Vma4
MSFAELQKALFTAAKERGEKTRAHLETKISREQERIGHEAQALEETIIEKAHAEGKQRENKFHQTAQLSARADILKAKQGELSATREQVKNEILAWDAKEATQLIDSLFSLIPDTAGTIRAGEVHRDLVRARAEKRGLTMAKKDIPGEGGFIFQSEKAEVNVTVGYLVTELFARHRGELACTLFD